MASSINDTGATSIRTSQSHPLEIASCTVPGGGVVGLSFCPGKQQATSMTGGWHRDLATDLDAIKAWSADVVLTLVEPQELIELNVPDLGEAVRARGMTWMHRPIPDQHAPDEAWMRAWPADRDYLSQTLRGHGRVFVHCKGGLGRAGTLGAMLLMDAGMHCNEAIAAVRAARGSGSIETVAQEHFLASYR